MATTFPKKINRYKFFTLSLLLIFLFCILLFNRRFFEPQFLLYRDLISQTPAPLLISSPRSTEFNEKLGDLNKNVDGNVTVSSELSVAEAQEKSNEERKVDASSKTDLDEKINDEITVPISSKSDLDDKNGEPMLSNETEVPISSKSDLDDKTDEPMMSNEEITVANSSKSDNDDKNSEPMLSNEEKKVPNLSNSDIGDKTDEPVLSNEEITVANSSGSDLDDEIGEPVSSNEDITEPISSKSDLDDKTRKKQEIFEEVASSDAEAGGVIDNAVAEKLRNCDIYKGTWVKDEGYPLYKPGSCPYVDEGFDCQGNGRPDSAYTQWRWKPDDCDLPRFNATDFLVKLRGKRLMLVGDSMNRNQFESLLCLLREALPDKSKMYETHGYKITKGRGYYIFKFEDYDCTVEFVRSHFLVREGIRINAQGNSNPTLSIDRIDKTARRWQRADILVFNTGHWWTHGKTARGKNYYKEGDYIYPHFDAVEAYRRAIKTWATWIKRNIKRNKLVFYRGYSSAHFRGGDWDSGGSCNGETEPVTRGAILGSYPQKMKIVDEVMKETHVPALLLNVTRLTNYRKDGHPSIYGKNVTRVKKVSRRRQDCSHWCLPGVPDAWNELIYFSLVAKQT